MPTNTIDWNAVNFNVALGHGAAGTYATVQGKKCLIVCVNLDHAALPISKGQLEYANKNGKKQEAIVPYIVKGNAQLESGYSFSVAVKPLRSSGGNGSLFD